MRTPTFSALRAGALAAALFLGATAHAESGLSLNTGVESRSGQYALLARPDTRVMPLTARYETPRLVYQLRVDYASADRAARLLASDSKLVRTAASNGYEPLVNLVASDVSASLTYKVPESLPGGWAVDLSAAVQSDTDNSARAQAFTSRSYIARADFSRSFGPLRAETGIGYKVRAIALDADLRNTAFAYAGGAYQLDARTKIELYLDHGQAARRGAPSEVEVSAYLNRQINDKLSLTGYALRALTSGAQDTTLGLLVSYRF